MPRSAGREVKTRGEGGRYRGAYTRKSNSLLEFTRTRNQKCQGGATGDGESAKCVGIPRIGPEGGASQSVTRVRRLH